jgi:multidrug efflux pump subunit AcrA (membrane-fusion protein)
MAADERLKQSAQGEFFIAKPAMREVTLTGYTRARHVMDIVSEEAGRCTKVTADVGDRIGKKGLYAVLDTTFIDLAIKKNRVNQKRLQNLVAYYAKDVSRFQELVGEATAAQSKLDEIQNKLDQSKFEIQSLRVEEAELTERRTRHHIKVPQGWTLIERAVEPGEWVSVGRELGRAGDFRTLLVPFSLSPGEYRALKKLNGLVRLLLPDEGMRGLVLNASLERISPAFDPETRKINVELGVGKGLNQKRGGLRAELKLSNPDPTGAILVPAPAVTERYEEFWLTRANGEKIRVQYLGKGPQNNARVRSPKVKPGDKFRLKP